MQGLSSHWFRSLRPGSCFLCQITVLNIYRGKHIFLASHETWVDISFVLAGSLHLPGREMGILGPIAGGKTGRQLCLLFLLSFLPALGICTSCLGSYPVASWTNTIDLSDSKIFSFLHDLLSLCFPGVLLCAECQTWFSCYSIYSEVSTASLCSSASFSSLPISQFIRQ